MSKRKDPFSGSRPYDSANIDLSTPAPAKKKESDLVAGEKDGGRESVSNASHTIKDSQQDLNIDPHNDTSVNGSMLLNQTAKTGIGAGDTIVEKGRETEL